MRFLYFSFGGPSPLRVTKMSTRRFTGGIRYRTPWFLPCEFFMACVGVFFVHTEKGFFSVFFMVVFFRCFFLLHPRNPNLFGRREFLRVSLCWFFVFLFPCRLGGGPFTTFFFKKTKLVVEISPGNVSLCPAEVGFDGKETVPRSLCHDGVSGLVGVFRIGHV